MIALSSYSTPEAVAGFLKDFQMRIDHQEKGTFSPSRVRYFLTISRYGKEFSTAQLAFVQNCVRAGYASFDGHTLALTPAGLIVQNSILAQLL